MLFNRDDYAFKWNDIGDIALGRPKMGEMTSVAVYRMMQYSMRSVLNTEIGGERAAELFYRSGFLAGEQFFLNRMEKDQSLNLFVAQLQQQLLDLGIGILRIEDADVEKLKFTLVVAEDLDCSGLPVSGETVCDYDEGFIAGVFEAYTGKPFEVKEIDCWSNGSRVCRFSVKVK
ncbi:MAG: 4-vinyl reductase [Lentimicrobium sp.]|jgi:predicted hydrocarbon binding protein|nr:4-vinyl reductase [Lentimicrobium sp.]